MGSRRGRERVSNIWYGMVWYGMVWYGMVWNSEYYGASKYRGEHNNAMPRNC